MGSRHDLTDEQENGSQEPSMGSEKALSVELSNNGSIRFTFTKGLILALVTMLVALFSR